MRTCNKIIRVLLAFVVTCFPVWISAAPLIDQIEALPRNTDHQTRMEAIKSMDYAGFKGEIKTIVGRAKSNLAAAESDVNTTEAERSALRSHLIALEILQDKFAAIGELGDDGKIEIRQFDTDDEAVAGCVVSTEKYNNHHVFDCDGEYRFAIEIWRQNILVRGLLTIWRGEARQFTLNQIRVSEIRWDSFSEKVTSDQFPWETLVNGWLIEGTIATPPTNQYRLLHPLALLSVTEEEGVYDEEIGIELLGLRTYAAESYDPEYGVSVLALLKSEGADNTGWGLSFSRNNFSIGVVRQELASGEEDTKWLLGYNLAQLFENKKNELAQQRRELLRERDQLANMIESIVSSD